jgi:GntR family transcriptional regulator
VRWSEEDLQPGPLPLWFQIAQRLSVAIEKGEFASGDVLPSESTLVKRFGVSRTTARSALDHLGHGGLIERRQGTGSIVLPPRVDQPLTLLSSFGEDMRARGLEPSYHTRRITRRSPSREVSEALGIDKGERAVLIDRLLLADGAPLAVSTSWIHPLYLVDHPLPTLAQLDSGSLYFWLETERGVRIARGTEYIEASTADAETSNALVVHLGAPILVARRLSRPISGPPVEYVVLRYRADRYRYHIEMVRP